VPQMELIAISIVTIGSIWHKLCVWFFLHCGKFPPQICESCGSTYRWNSESLVHCNLLLVL